MVNKIKGEVALSYGGVAYSLALDFNTLAEFEDAIGEKAMPILQDPAGMSIKQMRALFWCGLKQHHPEITLEEAGRILSANFDKLGEALSASFPDEDAGAGKPKRA